MMEAAKEMLLEDLGIAGAQIAYSELKNPGSK